MPSYRILLLVEKQVEPFRTRTPRTGKASLKPRYYEEGGVIEAEHPYEAWKRLQGERAAAAGITRELGVGDVLLPDDGRPLLLNYWGFDPADWSDVEVHDETTVEAV